MAICFRLYIYVEIQKNYSIINLSPLLKLVRWISKYTYAYIYIYIIPWNLNCKPKVSWFVCFCKTTIIRQLTKRNESKIENIPPKIVEISLEFLRGIVSKCVWLCACVGVDYSCVLLCAYVWVAYSVCVCEGRNLARCFNRI